MGKKPWGTLVNLFTPALEEKNIEITYNLNSSEIAKANQVVDEMQAQINRVQREIGFEGVNFLGDRDKKEQFALIAFIFLTAKLLLKVPAIGFASNARFAISTEPPNL